MKKVSTEYYTYIVPYDLSVWFATTVMKNFQVGSIFGVSLAPILKFHEIQWSLGINRAAHKLSVCN